MKAIKITIDGRSLFDPPFKETGWYDKDVKGFVFNIMNNPDGGGSFQCKLTGNETINQSILIEVK